MSATLEPVVPLPRLRVSPYAEKLLLAAYCGVLFFYGINAGCFYRTEALRAIVAREFLRSGNWVVPTLYGEPLLTKPPVHYALIAVASLPGGRVTEWSARLPSALAACVTVLIFYHWFGRALGRRWGVLAALIVPASVMWFERVPSAEIDMVQLAWVVGSLYCLDRAVEVAEQGTTSAPRWWVGALVCVAGGVLTKWTVPLFFYGTAVPFLWWRGRLRLLVASPHLTGVAIAGTLVLTWLAAVVWCVGWERLYDTVCQEALPKFLPGQRERGYPWLEILLLPARLLVGNLPWTGFALLTLIPRISRAWDADAKRLLAFFHCWLWPNLVFWSLAPNHAPRHSFPLSPAIAGLAALVLVAILSKQLRWPRFLPPAAPSLFATLLAVMVAKVVFVSVVVPDRLRGREPVEKGEMLARLVPPDATLYLFGVKDEGVMFYYGRPVQRFRDPSLLPSSDELLYCIITEPERERFGEAIRGEPLQELKDEQGARLFLVLMRSP